MNPAIPGVEARLYLVKVNRAAIYATLCRAISSGRPVDDTVVIVADTADSVGLELANAATTESRLNLYDETGRGQEHNATSTAIIVLSIEAARRLLHASHPRVADGLERQPLPGFARVVTVAAGAAMLVHSDVRATAPIANA